jgi:Protein of unknown function (DUF2750)
MTSDFFPRYERLVAAVTAGGSVWIPLIGGEEAVVDADDREAIPLWTEREPAVGQGDDAVKHDAPALLEWLERTPPEEWLAIEPDDEGWYMVPARELRDDLLQELGRAGRDPRDPGDEPARRDPEGRYAFFVEHVARDRAAWAVGDDENLLQLTEEAYVPSLALWPHARFALAFIEGEAMEGVQAHRLAWDDLLGDLEGMAGRQDEEVAVFPLAGEDEQCMFAAPGSLAEDLRRAAGEG